MIKRISRAAIVAALLFASQVHAASTWQVDASHSKILFTVTHMVINEVNGWFADFDGTMSQPKDDDFTGSVVNIAIKTASVSTGSEGRDKHLRGTDFFDTDKFPVTTFATTGFTKTGANEYTIDGTLDMHGVKKQVQVKARFNGLMKDGRGNMHAGFKGTTTINRTDFGLVWNKTLEAGGVLVSENVDLTLNMEFVKKQ